MTRACDARVARERGSCRRARFLPGLLTQPFGISRKGDPRRELRVTGTQNQSFTAKFGAPDRRFRIGCLLLIPCKLLIINDLAPQSGHVSNFCRSADPLIELPDVYCFQSDSSAPPTLVQGGYPVWTRLELAKGSPR